MAILRVVSGLVARFRAQRWSKEILLAIGLTLAAAGFIAAAITSGDGQVPDAPPHAANDR